MKPGPTGDPEGVYHSELENVARQYAVPVSADVGAAVLGVILDLKVSDLVHYNPERDAAGKLLVPGTKAARWSTKGTPTSCSHPKDVQIVKVRLLYAPSPRLPPGRGYIERTVRH